jgi:hypothetical protein
MTKSMYLQTCRSLKSTNHKRDLVHKSHICQVSHLWICDLRNFFASLGLIIKETRGVILIPGAKVLVGYCHKMQSPNKLTQKSTVHYSHLHHGSKVYKKEDAGEVKIKLDCAILGIALKKTLS